VKVIAIVKWGEISSSSYFAKLTPFKYHDLTVIGYSTTQYCCNTTKTTTSNRPTGLIVQKNLKSGSLSKNIYQYDFSYEEVKEFIVLFKEMSEYKLYKKIQKEIVDKLLIEFPNFKDLPDYIYRRMGDENWNEYYKISNEKSAN
jgi:hypothetical protein